MIDLLSFVYGLNITFLIYVFSYLTVKGMMGVGHFSALIVGFKFLIYWKLISFGFNHLPSSGILIGMTGGVYLSLPLLYWINKKSSAEGISSLSNNSTSPTLE